MTTYQSLVLDAAYFGYIPTDASERFRADVQRVVRHLRREQRTGTFRNLTIPTPRKG